MRRSRSGRYRSLTSEFTSLSVRWWAVVGGGGRCIVDTHGDVRGRTGTRVAVAVAVRVTVRV